MALLVAQTRVESGVHSVVEVTYGGVLGALVTLVDLPGVRVTPDLELLAEADAAAENAYAPYSKFHVGAAVRTTRRPRRSPA